MIIQDNLSEGLQLSIAQSCQAREVSRIGYYKWLNRPQPVPSDDVDLRDQIQEMALEFPGYGYRRVTAERKNRGYAVNHEHVFEAHAEYETFGDAIRNMRHFIEKVYTRSDCIQLWGINRLISLKWRQL